MLQRIYFKRDHKEISFDVIKCEGFSRVLGLMFKKKEHVKPLLFEFENSLVIHSFFVPFSFLAVWLDGYTVIKTELVQPFTPFIKSPKGSNCLIEVPIVDNYDNILADIKS